MSRVLWIAAMALLGASMIWVANLEEGDQWRMIGAFTVGLVALMVANVSGYVKRGEDDEE